ncbi:MAG: DUF3850 domain-containing protein [[Clostridium] innocuum]|nr:DUF3850 domain-containing protein [[Clostridium] innocuum]
MHYKVTWTMYFTDSNIPDTIAVAIVEAATVSKARYAAYKQMIPDRGYQYEWFMNETEVEKIETENEQMIHKLKILPQYFEDKLKGIKNWEIRNNDRPLKVDDILQLEEWSKETGYTGRMMQEYIKKIYTDVSGIEDGYIVMNTEYISASYKTRGE